MATGGRQLPNAAGKNEKQNDIATEGPAEKKMPVNPQNKKTTPPEVIPH